MYRKLKHSTSEFLWHSYIFFGEARDLEFTYHWNNRLNVRSCPLGAKVLINGTYSNMAHESPSHLSYSMSNMKGISKLEVNLKYLYYILPFIYIYAVHFGKNIWLLCTRCLVTVSCVSVVFGMHSIQELIVDLLQMMRCSVATNT